MRRFDCCPEDTPKAGDVYVCHECGCSVAVLRDCGSDGENCCLACCGKEMLLANPPAASKRGGSK